MPAKKPAKLPFEESEHLLLPAPEVVSTDPEMLAAWNSVIHWFEHVKKRDEQHKGREALHDLGCHMQLACKSLGHLLLQAAKEQEDEASKIPYLRAVQHVVDALAKITFEPVVQAMFSRGDSSFKVASGRAQSLVKRFEGSKHPSKPQDKLYIDAELLEESLRVWQNLALAIKIDSKQEGVKTKEVDNTVKWLLEHRTAQTEEPSRVHPLDDPLLPASKRPRQRSPPLQEDPISLREALQFDEKRSICLKMIDSLAPRIKDDHKMACLVRMAIPGGPVDAQIVDGYFELLCSHRNAIAATEQTMSSPRWHAWPTSLMTEMVTRQLEHPSLPDETTWEVMHHIFPLHLKQTWGMAVLSRHGETWLLQCFSSMPDFRPYIQKAWPKLAQWLEGRYGKLEVANAEVSVPPQPESGEGPDSGIYLLCEARLLSADFPLDMIDQGDMSFLRRRLVFEIENKVIDSTE